MDPTLCPFCSESIHPGTERCPHCGEVLGAKPIRQATGWGSPHQPMSVAVFGWLNIIFGAFGLLGSGMFVVMFAVMGSNNFFLNQSLGEPGSAFRAFQTFNMVVGGLVSVLYLVSGYGLLRFRPFARKLALGIAGYAVVSSIVTPFFSIPMVLERAPPGQEQLMVAMSGAGVLIALIYPVLTLFFLTRPHVGAAFAHWDAKKSA